MKKFILPILLIIFIIPTTDASAARHRRHNKHHHVYHHHIIKHEPAPVIISEWKGTLQEALIIAEQKAYELWGEYPCNSMPIIEITKLPSNEAGNSAWQSPSGENVYSSPSFEWTNCRMKLQENFWNENAIKYYWIDACTIVLHEWGHLTGHPHSEKPLGVVNPEPPEAAGMTQEQLEVMKPYMNIDIPRCGWNP